MYSKVCSYYVYGSLIFWSALFCAVMIVPCLIVWGLRPKKRALFFQWVILQYGKVMIHIAAWPVVRVKYIDRAKNERLPGIYVFNHRSGSDPFLVAALNLPVIQIVNGWPMKLPFFGFFARQGEYIDATQTSPEEIVSRIDKALNNRVSVVAFPEGTRSGSREMNQFHSGIFRVAKELDVPLYPCCIIGNEKLPDRQFRFVSGRVLVIRNGAVPMELVRTKNAYVLKNKLRQMIAETIAEYE